MSQGGYERRLQWECKIAGLPEPTAEYFFAKPRRWRFDLAFVDQKLAVEVEGGIWVMGRHTRGKGYEKDMTKYNEAAISGWRLIRVSPAMVKDGRALAWVERALKHGR